MNYESETTIINEIKPIRSSKTNHNPNQLTQPIPNQNQNIQPDSTQTKPTQNQNKSISKSTQPHLTQPKPIQPNPTLATKNKYIYII